VVIIPLGRPLGVGMPIEHRRSFVVTDDCNLRCKYLLYNTQKI